MKSLEVVGRYESARCDEGIDKFRLWKFGRQTFLHEHGEVEIEDSLLSEVYPTHVDSRYVEEFMYEVLCDMSLWEDECQHVALARVDGRGRSTAIRDDQPSHIVRRLHLQPSVR